jgi:hypothetical protein
MEWMAEGEARGKTESLLEVLALKFGVLPSELEAGIRANSDLATLRVWLASAVSADTLDGFRQNTGL